MMPSPAFRRLNFTEKPAAGQVAFCAARSAFFMQKASGANAESMPSEEKLLTVNRINVHSHTYNI